MMAEESDAAAASPNGVQTPPLKPEKSGAATEESEKGPSSDEAAPAEDAANADVTPVKRKSHRPSLEVVEVTVDSFYDKGAFKQELQVGTEEASYKFGYHRSAIYVDHAILKQQPSLL